MTPVQASLSTSTDEIHAILEPRGFSGLGREAPTVHANAGNTLAVSLAVEPLNARSELNRHPGDRLHRATIELFIGFLRLEASLHLALELLELLRGHPVLALPHADALKSPAERNPLIRVLRRCPHRKGDRALPVVTRSTYGCQVGSVVRRRAIGTRDDVIHLCR